MTEKKNTEIRREEIILASLSLVEQFGLDNLNIAAIAGAINLVPAAIYRHFAGKEAIIASLIAFVGTCLQDNIFQALTKENNAVCRLELLLNLHVELIQRQRAIPRILFSLLGSDKNAYLKQKMLTVINLYVAQVKRILDVGQEKGEILADVDTGAAAILFLGMVQPLAVLGQSNERLINSYPGPLWKIYQRGIIC